MDNPVYLDYAATTPLRPEVREAMLPLMMDNFGNPSSVHRWGRKAKVQLEEARATIAKSIGAEPAEIIFTRGGTEADNLAIFGRSREVRSQPVICSAIEHRAILNTAKEAGNEGGGFETIPVDANGVVRLEDFDRLLELAPSVVSVMWANNEVGSIQPVGEIAGRCSQRDIPFHSDAVQAFGKLNVRVDEVPFAMLSLSAHKIGGPKGVGALFVRRGTRLHPMVFGGGHERGLRAGTEDVAGAVGFAAAAQLALSDRESEMARIASLRDRLQAELVDRVPDLVVNGAGAERLPTILNVSAPGANNELLLMTLDLEGIAVSSGSACSSGGVTPSHVLTRMGLKADVAGPSVRFSLGHETTDGDIERALEVFPPVIERLRSMATL